MRERGRLGQSVAAPHLSFAPESVIPSADHPFRIQPIEAQTGKGVTFQMFLLLPAVLLPESFRGGCSFGAGRIRSLPRDRERLTRAR